MILFFFLSETMSVAHNLWRITLYLTIFFQSMFCIEASRQPILEKPSLKGPWIDVLTSPLVFLSCMGFRTLSFHEHIT